MLDFDSNPKSMKEWSLELIEELSHSAGLLDEINGGTGYLDSLQKQLDKVNNPNLTPSGQMLKEMTDKGLSFFEFSMQQSRQHHELLSNNGLDETSANHMSATAGESHLKQKEIEASDELGFDEFLVQWNEA